MSESNKISTILQCFVDTNLELNEDFIYSQSNIPSVFFTQETLVVQEGTSVSIEISLSEPSSSGQESLSLAFIPITADASDVDTVFPQNITWSEGEQVKNIQIDIKKDFELEQGKNQSFNLALVSAFNCSPEEDKSLLKVSITDTTVFNLVSFKDTNTSVLLENGNTEFLSDTYDLDSPVTLKIGLNNPSEGGVEKCNVKIYRLNNLTFDGRFSGIITSIPISFEAGEQFKEVVISNISESILSTTPILVATIENTVKVRLDDSSGANKNVLLYVDSNSLSINRRWTTLNIGDIYRQKGPSDNGKIQFRSPVSSEVPQELTEAHNSWLLKYGNNYIDNTNNEDVGFPSVNYPNYPLYRFGPSIPGFPNDMELEITNDGEYDILFDGNIVSPGEVVNSPVPSNGYEILLPSNSQLIEAGEIIPQSGGVAIDRLYAQSLYSFKLKYVNSGYTAPNNTQVFSHNFTLQGGSENSLEIGSFELENYSNVFESQLNKYYLCSYYSSVITRYGTEGCSNSFNESTGEFNVRMLGAILLDDSEPVSLYEGFEFIKLENFNPVCGAVNSNYISPLWLGIPFEISEFPS